MRKFFKKIFEAVFPCQCLCCSKVISEEALFCSTCWQKLQFITEPKCNICSHPFEQSSANSLLLCPICLIKKPPYKKAISLLHYNSAAKKIIGDLKYRDTTYLAKKLAKFLYNKTKSELENIDLVVAVPLHAKKLRQRKFNQSTLLAKELAKLLNKEFSHDFLIKDQNTKPQASLTKKERQQNLKNAFKLNLKYQETVKNKNILLIDDVITTGSTLEACSKVLKKHGANDIVVLTVAKAVFR